jgi:hypothetical protein
MISGPRLHAFGGLQALVTQAVRTIPRTNESVAVHGRPTHFGRHCREMRLAVIFPFVTDDPSKAMIAVMDVCRQLPRLACRLPTDACLNVAISVSFGQAVSVRSNTEISAGKLTYPISAGNASRGTCSQSVRVPEDRGQKDLGCIKSVDHALPATS